MKFTQHSQKWHLAKRVPHSHNLKSHKSIKFRLNAKMILDGDEAEKSNITILKKILWLNRFLCCCYWHSSIGSSSLSVHCLSVCLCMFTYLSFSLLLLYLCCLFVVLFICSLSHCLFHDLFLSMSVFVCLPACPFSLFICSSLFSIFVLLFVCS